MSYVLRYVTDHWKWIGLWLAMSLGMGLFMVFLIWGVDTEKLRPVDFALLVKLQDHVSPRLDSPLVWTAVLGSWQVVALLLLFIILYLRSWWLSIGVAFIYVLGLGVLAFIRSVIIQPAPFFQFYRGIGDFAFHPYYVHTMSSFPSGHAFRIVFMSTIVTGLLYMRRHHLWKLGGLMGLGISLLVMLSQVILGRHWMSDVVVGGITGGLMGSFCVWIFDLVREWQDYRQNLAITNPRSAPAITSDAK